MFINEYKLDKIKQELKNSYQKKINEIRDNYLNEIENLTKEVDSEKRKRIYSESELSEYKEEVKSEFANEKRKLEIMKNQLDQDSQKFERQVERVKEELKQKDVLLSNAKNRLKEQVEFEANNKIAKILGEHNSKLLNSIEKMSEKSNQPNMITYKND